jgi:Tol biopolymer transport system component
VKRLAALASLGMLAGLVLSGSVVRGGEAAGAPRAAASGTVVFSSNRDGDYEIYAVNPDGTGLTQLTHNDFEDSSPHPSPDGSLIAFYSGGDFALMNADGSGRRALEPCSGTDASWSPDSRNLVCPVGYHDGLAVVNVATGSFRTLVRTGGENPSWSPDGRTIAYIDAERLFVVPADGGARRRLGRHRYDGWHGASWSPDSQRLAYTGAVGTKGRADLFTIGADGSGERSVVRRITEIAPLEWSPAGSLIAFMKDLPRYGMAIYTVRPDGTGLRRVSASPGGESSRDPTWSNDGTRLLYLRQRYREAEDDDIYVTTPGSGRGRPITHPFPQGGTNLEPHWTPGAPLSGGEPAPPTITLPLTRALAFKGPLASLITDGRRAIPNVGGDSRSKGLLVWDAIARRSTRVRAACSSSEVALAGTRLAWACYDSGNTYTDIVLETQRLGARRPTFVAETNVDSDGNGQTLGSLVGHGNTIAFTIYHGKAKRAKAWLLLPRRGRKCPRNSYLIGPAHAAPMCRLLKKAAGGSTISVDAGRVLTLAPNGVVRLLSTQDRLLRTWRLGRHVVNARLRGRTLAVQEANTLDIYDTVNGAKRQTLPLAADEGLPPYLLDVQGDLAAYATGGAIHLLRLSDGRDVALALPRAAPWLDARLERGGLFVSWNRMYDRRPGRLAFIPMRTVMRGFG